MLYRQVVLRSIQQADVVTTEEEIATVPVQWDCQGSSGHESSFILNRVDCIPDPSWPTSSVKLGKTIGCSHAKSPFRPLMEERQQRRLIFTEEYGDVYTCVHPSSHPPGHATSSMLSLKMRQRLSGILVIRPLKKPGFMPMLTLEAESEASEGYILMHCCLEVARIASWPDADDAVRLEY